MSGHYYFNKKGNTDGKQFSILIIAWVIKFLPGTFVSLIFSETPVWLKGARHMFSFLFSFALLQFWPEDAFFSWVHGSTEAKMFVFVSCALYKMRKIAFSVMHPAIPDNQWILKILVAFIVCEGGSTFRKWESWRSGGCFTDKFTRAFHPKTFHKNASWGLSQYGPTLLAIALVGAGQKCWLCPGTSWSDMTGLGWTPVPLKVRAR